MGQELEKQFIETEPVEQQAWFWTAMYYYMAKEAIDRHGVEGERVIRQAIRDYGKERGRRRRNRVLKKGLDVRLSVIICTIPIWNISPGRRCIHTVWHSPIPSQERRWNSRRRCLRICAGS